MQTRREVYAHRTRVFKAISVVFAPRRAHSGRAGLETLGLVHEHKFVIILRAKSAGFSNLRYTRIESTSVGCSARLADYIDTEGVGVVQQTGIPGKVSNRDQDVPWMLMVTFRISRRPTRSITGTARPCKSHGIVTHARAAVTGICWHHSLRKRIVHCVGGSSSLLSVN